MSQDESPFGPPQDVELKCENCLYVTDKVREAMRHAEDTGHSITGPGPIEGTILTVSITRDGDE